MSNDGLSEVVIKSAAGDTTRRAPLQGELASQTGGREAARPTFGVYDRPARRTKLSAPYIIILILSVLVSLVAAARYLF